MKKKGRNMKIEMIYCDVENCSERTANPVKDGFTSVYCGADMIADLCSKHSVDRSTLDRRGFVTRTDEMRKSK